MITPHFRELLDHAIFAHLSPQQHSLVKVTHHEKGIVVQGTGPAGTLTLNVGIELKDGWCDINKMGYDIASTFSDAFEKGPQDPPDEDKETVN